MILSSLIDQLRQRFQHEKRAQVCLWFDDKQEFARLLLPLRAHLEALKSHPGDEDELPSAGNEDSARQEFQAQQFIRIHYNGIATLSENPGAGLGCFEVLARHQPRARFHRRFTNLPGLDGPTDCVVFSHVSFSCRQPPYTPIQHTIIAARPASVTV